MLLKRVVGLLDEVFHCGNCKFVGFRIVGDMPPFQLGHLWKQSVGKAFSRLALRVITAYNYKCAGLLSQFMNKKNPKRDSSSIAAMINDALFPLRKFSFAA